MMPATLAMAVGAAVNNRSARLIAPSPGTRSTRLTTVAVRRPMTLLIHLQPTRPHDDGPAAYVDSGHNRTRQAKAAGMERRLVIGRLMCGIEGRGPELK